MSTQHFFLSSPDSTLPERLREAFADIAPLSAAALLARLPALPAAQSLLWLSSNDAQWPQALRQILQAKPDARVVLLSGVPEPIEGLRALNDGARGYTHAYGVPALLQEVALQQVGAGPNAWALLSAREVQVARAVAAGRSNREVAAKMFISERTVKAHLGAIFEKLGVRDRLQLVLRLAASPEPAATSTAEPKP
jgi:DNA-binding NarL/FixJ family response regulator